MFKNMLNEFKEFAMRGNVIDMAVGIIIGAAFGKVVSSLVSDIMMPPIGYLLGKVDFSNLVLTLHEKTADSPAVVISYGAFINTIIDFIIVAFAIFIVIKQVNRFTQLQKKPAEVTTKDCPYCCSKVALKATRCPDCTSELK
jgi:large conductance mechanosensitive channel